MSSKASTKSDDVKRLRDMPKYSEMCREEQRRVSDAMAALVLSFSITVLPISNNCGVHALFWSQVWGRGTSFAGPMMAVGELMGLVTLQTLATPCVFQLSILQPFKKPVNLVLATFSAGFAVGLVTVPSEAISAIGSVGVHAINV